MLGWIKHGVRVQWRTGPPAPFHRGASLLDATADERDFLSREIPRLVSEGAWEVGTSRRFVSRMFLVPKDEGRSWRMVLDLRHLNSHCKAFPLKMETLKRMRNLSTKGDWMFSFDLQDGYYALGIAPEHRDYFSFEYDGVVYRLAGLPMGWNASPYYFCRLMHSVVRYLRNPAMAESRALRRPRKVTRVRGRRWKGARLLPFMDDFLFIAASYEEALALRERVESLLGELGMARNPKKGTWEPTQRLTHLGLEIDLARGVFRAPVGKLDSVRQLARAALGTAARSQRWVPAKLLASLAGKAQFLYLAIPAARFYLRELHDVLVTRTSWSGKVKLTNQLKRDLLWWREVPNQRNERSIYKPVETAYLHVDSSDFGWGAVLNETFEARGFWYEDDRAEHITFKELKAVRYAVMTFLEELRGRRVLLHEDNQAVVSIVTHLTSRSPRLMTELRKLWFILDEADIHLRPRYIRSAANVWADRLSRETDTSDWRLNPRVFAYLDRLWGPHTIDRFATMENAQVPRYNARWRDPACEATDSLHLNDDAWRDENNWCNAPWSLLPDLTAKLRQSGAAATVIAPNWVGEGWHQELLELADELIVYPPSRDLFFPGRSGVHAGVGPPRWSVVAARVNSHRGYTRGETTYGDTEPWCRRR